MPFRIQALEKSLFQHLFELSSEDLKLHRAIRMKVTEKPGFPCRVSLADAEIGEDVILAHYEHLTTDSPFKASHAIYVRRNAEQPDCKVDEVPRMLRARILSLRAFDEAGMMTASDLIDGSALEAALDAMLKDSQVSFIHLHFAKPGCYAARVIRA